MEGSICLQLFLWHAYLTALSAHSCWVNGPPLMKQSPLPPIRLLNTQSIRPLRLIWSLSMDWTGRATEPPTESRRSHFPGHDLCSGRQGIRAKHLRRINCLKRTAQGWESDWILVEQLFIGSPWTCVSEILKMGAFRGHLLHFFSACERLLVNLNPFSFKSSPLLKVDWNYFEE